MRAGTVQVLLLTVVKLAVMKVGVMALLTTTIEKLRATLKAPSKAMTEKE